MNKTLQWLSLTTILALPLLFQSTFTEILKLRTFDYLIERPESSGVFVVVNLEEQDLADYGGWPLKRSDLAKIHMDLLNSGALGVGYGISFNYPDRFGGDDEFASALRIYPSLLSMFERDDGTVPRPHGTVLLGPEVDGLSIKGVIENIDTLKNAAQQGLVSAPLDKDGLVRKIPLVYKSNDAWVASFGAQILKILTQSSTYIIKTSENGIQEVTVQGLPPVKTDSLSRVWLTWAKTSQTTLKNAKVDGKFVILGTNSAGILPQISTPVGLLEPHLIQAALAEQMLIPNSPYIPDWSLAAELAIYGLTVGFIWLFLNVFGITFGFILSVSTMALTAFIGVHLVSRGLLLDVSWSLISGFITGSVASYLNYRTQYKLKQQIKAQFGKFVSPDVVAELQAHPEKLRLGGERKEMSFLFMDIVGFTPVSEFYSQKDDPEGLVDLVNNFLDRMTKILLARQGTIDKYMGDCIFCFWNSPLDTEKHAEQAVLAAKELEEEARIINEEFVQQGLPEIKIGTGINTGTTIVGMYGSELRLDYSVMSDAVNLAARLESQTRNYDCDTLISEHTVAQAPDISFTFVDEIQVKGKEERVKVYTI